MKELVDLSSRQSSRQSSLQIASELTNYLRNLLTKLMSCKINGKPVLESEGSISSKNKICKS